MGRGIRLVAERDGEVLAAIGASLRTLALEGVRRRLAYLGGAKAAPGAAGARAWLRLALAVRRWALAGGAQGAYAVVMEGTRASPDRYSGRLGLEPLSELGAIEALRIPAGGGRPDPAWSAASGEAEARWRELSRRQLAPLDGEPALRSESRPRWLLCPRGRAVGLLEDTRRAKRLHEILPGGGERPMRAWHLSRCRWLDPGSGERLVRQALARLPRSAGEEALFLACSPAEARELAPRLASLELVRAPAAIWGTGVEPGLSWSVSASEI